MKKIFGILILAAVTTGCMRDYDEKDPSNEFAAVAVINASATNTTGLTNGNVRVDTIIQSGSQVAFRGNTGYFSVRPGTRNLDYVGVTGAANNVKFVNLSGETFEAGKAYTYIVYDTLTSPTASLRSIRLTDDLMANDDKAATASVRFLHLAPRTGSVDVTFVRTNPGATDSVTVTNRAYIGTTPSSSDIAALSRFDISLPLGFAGTYTIRVKNAGTQTVIASLVSALTLTGFDRSINTVYLTGGAQGTPLAVSNMRNYPQ